MVWWGSTKIDMNESYRNQASKLFKPIGCIYIWKQSYHLVSKRKFCVNYTWIWVEFCFIPNTGILYKVAHNLEMPRGKNMLLPVRDEKKTWFLIAHIAHISRYIYMGINGGVRQMVRFHGWKSLKSVK